MALIISTFEIFSPVIRSKKLLMTDVAITPIMMEKKGVMISTK